ncbi:MAG: 50S ribosomal protein L25 [Candidatus Rokubacteria bacterium]|nr:50S ribosomal protein L25 [Candidatus Rokubacteria bacterium]
MEFRELKITKREATGKQAAKHLRRQGLVPAVLYGGNAPEALTVDARDVLKVIHGREGSATLLNLKFEEGSDSARAAIIRDMQFDPVTEKLIHVDLQEVSMDRPITVGVPVQSQGEAEGVKDQGGILAMILREVQVSCLPRLIPERITVDVSGLKIGDVLTVSMLTPPEAVRILNDPGQAVVTVSPPMAEEVAAPAAAAVEAAPAEPEVLTERKPRAEEAEAAESKPESKKEPKK